MTMIIIIMIITVTKNIIVKGKKYMFFKLNQIHNFFILKIGVKIFQK